jgi:alpha-galactosidase
VGPTTSHSTGRTHDLEFRAATALFGHFGIEWDIRQASDDDRTALTAAIGVYKAWRDVIHTGRMVRVDHPDPASQITGVVAHDGGRAIFSWATLATSAAETPLPVRLPGLDPDRVYRVRTAMPVPEAHVIERGAPAWLADGMELSGTALAVLGLPMPILNPEHAVLITAEAIA